ncbi:hypothetical protein [Vallitalea okinawensis]|uniref:hypothetical protein n=1 Tax=Vallitalea okinawensis TaxID=2078660 RepID=UPI000CFAC85C|nr:hypothetical protein [Vallitalea okinawensis]
MKFENFRKKVLFIDGSYRDVIVENAQKNDWLNYFEFLNLYTCEVKVYIGSEVLELNNEVYDIIVKSLEKEMRVLLEIRLGDVIVNCHFFDIEIIEMDIDPREFNEVSSIRLMVEFFESMANFLGKEIKLTVENGWEVPLYVFTPIDIND